MSIGDVSFVWLLNVLILVPVIMVFASSHNIYTVYPAKIPAVKRGRILSLRVFSALPANVLL